MRTSVLLALVALCFASPALSQESERSPDLVEEVAALEALAETIDVEKPDEVPIPDGEIKTGLLEVVNNLNALQVESERIEAQRQTVQWAGDKLVRIAAESLGLSLDEYTPDANRMVFVKNPAPEPDPPDPAEGDPAP